jgi:hypothetical protein
MRRVHLLKANLLFGFDIDPAAIRNPTTRKSDKARPLAVDDRKFQIAIQGCGGYQLPFHDGDSHP